MVDFKYIEGQSAIYRSFDTEYEPTSKNWLKLDNNEVRSNIVSSWFINTVLSDQSSRGLLAEIGKKKRIGFVGRSSFDSNLSITDLPNATLDLADNFPGSSLDTDNWETVGSPTITVDSNKLNISSNNSGNYVRSKTDINFTNKAASAKHTFADPAQNGQLAQFLVSNTGLTNYALFQQQNNILYFADHSGALGDIPYDVVEHAYLRIQFLGGITYWQVSSDGIDWQNVYSKTTNFTITALRVLFRMLPSTAGTRVWDIEDYKLESQSAGTQTGVNRLIEVDEDDVYHIIENGVRVKTWNKEIAEVGNEPRVQIVQEGGDNKVKYWYRKDTNETEKLMHISSIPSNAFPLHAKLELEEIGSSMTNFSIEESHAGDSQLSNTGEPPILDTGETLDIFCEVELELNTAFSRETTLVPKTKKGWLHPLGAE